MKYTVKVKPRGGEVTEFNTEQWSDVSAIARFHKFPLETLAATRQLRNGRHRIAAIHWVMEHGSLTINNNRKLDKPTATTYGTSVGSDWHFAGSQSVLLKPVRGDVWR